MIMYVIQKKKKTSDEFKTRIINSQPKFEFFGFEFVYFGFKSSSDDQKELKYYPSKPSKKKVLVK